MRDEQLRTVAAAGLVIGAVLGMAGSFAPTAALRGLAWGIDGVALVVATALLGVMHLRRGDVQLAAGFLVYMVGESFMVSGSPMALAASTATIGAGLGLWSAALALVSTSLVIPRFVRVTGSIASILFGVTAARIFAGAAVTPLSEPLPFYGYPFLAATLFGWAWVHVKGGAHGGARHPSEESPMPRRPDQPNERRSLTHAQATVGHALRAR
jgi:hypothetical protein